MIALCAYWEGTVRDDPADFDQYVRDVHMPMVAKYPNLRKLRYLKGEPRNGIEPKYYLSFELFFDSLEDFQVAAVSEERNRAVADAETLANRFDGVIHHVMYEVVDIPVPE